MIFPTRQRRRAGLRYRAPLTFDPLDGQPFGAPVFGYPLNFDETWTRYTAGDLTLTSNIFSSGFWINDDGLIPGVSTYSIDNGRVAGQLNADDNSNLLALERTFHSLLGTATIDFSKGFEFRVAIAFAPQFQPPADFETDFYLNTNGLGTLTGWIVAIAPVDATHLQISFMNASGGSILGTGTYQAGTFNNIRVIVTPNKLVQIWLNGAILKSQVFPGIYALSNNNNYPVQCDWFFDTTGDAPTFYVGELSIRAFKK